jgi:hypothetical protein
MLLAGVIVVTKLRGTRRPPLAAPTPPEPQLPAERFAPSSAEASTPVVEPAQAA